MKRKLRYARSGLRRRSGQSLVEMALVLLFILAPMLMGIMDFGWFVRNNYILGNATREGARIAALGKTKSETTTRINNAISGLSITGSATVELKYVPSGITVNSSTTWLDWPDDSSSSSNQVPVDAQIRVKVSATHRSLTNFFTFFRNRTISQTTVSRREL